MADQTERLLSLVVDPGWYLARYPDVAASGATAASHFTETGLRERRDPNRWFDGAWYSRQYPDVAASGAHPLLHYLSEGASKGRDPNPRFDAGWYVEQYPEAAGNPLLFHLRIGAGRGWPTERRVAIEDYLPSTHAPFDAPARIETDIIIPVYRDFTLTRRCLESVLADNDRPSGRIVVINDRSPELKLTAWLEGLERSRAITLLRNKKNLGFVASVNRGMEHAGDRDVVLLNSDTEVPSGWLRRLCAQAYAEDKIASVSPLSNNATICSFLGFEGGPMPAGISLAEIDAACRAANAGRFADAPTTVGFCMYIRRAALREAGAFDAATFGKGYGEENDFCLRATDLGWRHRIACDTFVRHEGGASFGALADAGITRAFKILTERYPIYPELIARYVDKAETAPSRFAAAMELFRASGLPTILVLSHDLEGGVRRYLRDMVERDSGRANYLLLAPASRGVALSVPALAGLPGLMLAAERWRDVAAVARSAHVSRVHIHHLLGLDLDARSLIHELGAPFDVTVHDYFSICPQVTLLPWPAGRYCEEPGPAACDACIAQRASHGATDILSWRLRWAWQFQEADHVYAPSEDALARLTRHGITAGLLPLETVTPGPWRLHPLPRSGPLRVAVLGTLADHKGAHLVASVAMAADPAKLRIHLIGDTEANFPATARERLKIHGCYSEGELSRLLETSRPHVVWFPACWPETWSYTLSAAIEAGLPIVAAEIGAFPERLVGRALTWLAAPSPDPQGWLTIFDTVAETLRARRSKKPPVCVPLSQAKDPRKPSRLGPLIRGVPHALELAESRALARSGGSTSIVVIPETFGDGSFTPCAHIRLLRPLDHPNTSRGLITTLADPMSVMRYRADAIVTQRHAIPSIAAADAVIAHARQTKAQLIFDLDDDLLTIPPDHPEANDLAPRGAVVEHMVRLADTVRTSTEALAARIAPLARRVEIVPNLLDERIWLSRGRPPDDNYGPVRIVCMGTATHDADFAVISPALSEIHRRFGDQILVDLIGVVAGSEVPAWIRRLAPSRHATRSYPGFVHWINRVATWDIGLAPLAGTGFNACKSAIKVLDYAALGLAVLASDVTAYRGSLADGAGGWLVPNTDDAWYRALSLMIRDGQLRRRLAMNGSQALWETGILASSKHDIWPRARSGHSRRAS